MVISIVGTGYVGLVTGAIFADLGHKVFCVDIDENKIENLKKGIMPFFEPGLEEIVKKNVKIHRLSFTTHYSAAIPQSKIVFICVGTPADKNGAADLSYIKSAIEETSDHLKGYTLIVIKSTAPVGIEKMLHEITSQKSKSSFEFACCPEFLKEGSALSDSRTPDRIVIGTQSKKGERILMDLYKPFNGNRILCDIRSAQMIKYASNTFLASKISFSNAIAILAEKLGADAEVVLEGVGLDHRIGKAFLKPGIGYGGSCFPKDVAAFIETARDNDYDFEFLKAVNKINCMQVDFFLEKVIRALKQVNGKTLCILGLSFKPNTSDIRESQSIKIVLKLLELGAKVKVYDPEAVDNSRRILGNKVSYDSTPYGAASKSDALLILTEWDEFKEMDLNKIKKLMKNPVILDGRNIYDPKKVKQLGFIYQGIGRS